MSLITSVNVSHTVCPSLIPAYSGLLLFGPEQILLTFSLLNVWPINKRDHHDRHKMHNNFTKEVEHRSFNIIISI